MEMENIDSFEYDLTQKSIIYIYNFLLYIYKRKLMECKNILPYFCYKTFNILVVFHVRSNFHTNLL